MTVLLAEVKARVAAIVKAADCNDPDHETLHGQQDDLYLDVLTAIATGQCKDAPPEDFADEAIKVNDVSFARWYA